MAILQDAAETCFLSSPEVARRYGVDAATVVRTVQALGYERYADFGADLREHLLSRLSPYTIFKTELQKDRSFDDRIRHSLHCDSANIQALISGLDINEVMRAAQAIHEARRIYVIGVDTASSLAFFLAYVLRSLGLPAESPIPSEGYLRYTTQLLGAGDLVIGISFGRCLRTTMDVVLAARAQGVATLGITDTPNSPMARACDHFLTAPISSSLFFGSFVAPLSVINALLVASAYYKSDESLRRLEQMEESYRSGTRWYEPLL